MISKTWTSWEQSHEYQTKMRGEWLRCCGRWCQRQQRDREGKCMILFVILLHWWDDRECNRVIERDGDMVIFRFFQDGGRPPSWICDVCVGTIHEGHLVVCITVQNLVGIDAAVFIICTFSISRVWLENAYSRPQNGFLWVWPPKWTAIWTKYPKRHTRARVRVVWAIMRENLSTGLTRRWVPKTGINKKWLYFTHVPRSPPWTDMYLIWHSYRGLRHNHLWQIFWWSVEGCRFCGGRKLPFPIDKASGR